MHVLIVQAHPETTSFNGQLSAAARSVLETSGHTVTVSNLYESGFNPIEAGRHYRDRLDVSKFVPLAEQRHASDNHSLPSDVLGEIEKLEAADTVILQFPLWWHGPPAILKGWFDRVFVSGKIYRSQMRYDTGYFRGKQALVSVTTGAPEAAFGPGARGGDMNVMLWPIHYSLHYLGFSVLAPQCHFEVSGHGYSYGSEAGTRRQIGGNIDNWSKRLLWLSDEEPLSFPTWADWDEAGRLKENADRQFL
ncbi:MAG: NAD(P)H-dependent oxidoreductase [Phyllobacterium sp.]